ncbi:MAG: alpha-2-macroglobulin family protein, partial [Candidatus Eremiobacteraeota bacterium]|nr:alpha-2-macroglobulin family protein [Candidatus Eremiobacteraeota bacterium]
MHPLARPLAGFAVAAAALFASGCVSHAPGGPAPLAAISPLPAPSPRAPVLSVAPVGAADTLAQIRIRFTDDLIPLERLESPDERAILDRFSIAPALPGRFRFLTPRMIAFEADRAWPGATRIRVTVAKGLRDVHGRTLDADLSWTFETPLVTLSDLPGSGDDEQTPRDVRPRLEFTANLPLDRASLEAHAQARPRGGGSAVSLALPPETASPQPTATEDPQSAFDPSAHDWRYALVPTAALRKGTTYDLAIEPGVLPRDGNRPTERAFHGKFTTYDALAFLGAKRGSAESARFTGGDPRLAFSTPIDEKSLSALALEPAPPRGTHAFAVIDGGVAVDAALLAPQTEYRVRIGAELRDTYGQRLGAAHTAAFRTGDLAPDVWAPNGLNLFASSRDVRLNVYAVNAPAGVRAIFRPLTPADVVLHPDVSGAPDRGDVLPPPSSWPAFDVRGPRNVERTIEVPLRERLRAPAGVLAYGLGAQLRRGEDPFVAAGVVQLTDLGTFVQWFPDGGSVRVHRIADGTPVAGAQVEVYPSQAQSEAKTAPVRCATATTGTDGVATFAGPSFAACAADDGGEDSAPSLVTIVRRGDDWTYVRTQEYTGAYIGDLDNSWSSAKPLARGDLYSDRMLYQPGETVQMSGAAWFLVDGRLRHGVAPSYGLTLELPNGTKRDLGRRSADAFGAFAFPVAVRRDDPLGYYIVRAGAGNGEQVSGSFRVAEFKPPTFKVDLTLDRAFAVRGTTVSGTASNRYLFGAPLAGATTAFTVTRSPSSYAPKGRDGFTFGRRWFWPEQQPDAATDVLQTSATVDGNGASTVAVPVANDLPFAMDYLVDAQTTDASNIAVADEKTFTALPSDTLIGVAADDVGTAGRPLAVRILATDPAGKARANMQVHVELQLARYASATQVVEGAEAPVDSVTYETTASTDLTTGEDAVTARLTPAKPGTYRVRATRAGAQNDPGETDAEVWVGGGGETLWYARDPNQLTVKLDRATYRPGDTATVLVQSPFPAAELHVSVVRHGVLWETTAPVRGATPSVRFRVTPEMVPNAAVEAFAVRRGPPPRDKPADGGNALARVGFAPFEVAHDAKVLHVDVHPASGTLRPAARQTIALHVADAAHRPAFSELTVIVANEAVLQLTGYRPPDLAAEVYADQPIATRFADNREALVLATLARPAEKGWGFGGGLSSEEQDPRVRRRFSPLAYFTAALRTDANGDARVSFTVPDDLTTWRVMAVASTSDARFGRGDTTFRTTQPLIANPVVPQFARPGDRFDAGVAVTNGTGAAGTLSIDGTLSGPLAFAPPTASPSPATSLQVPLERQTRAYRFPMVASEAGTATATFRVRGGGAGDAFEIPVPVRDADVLEAVVQTGTTASRAEVPLSVAAGTPRNTGGLDVVLASSLLPEIDAAAQSALLGDERVAIASASRLAVAADLALLAQRDGGEARTARALAAAEIALLRGLRRADGGFAAYWRAEGSDAEDSLTALAALAQARAAHIDDGGLVDGARAYAAAVLADPAARAKWCSSEDCKARLRLHALDALAAAGDRRTTFFDDIDARRDALPFADRARLARLMELAPEWRSRGDTLSGVLEASLSASAMGAVVNLPARYAWFDEPAVTQSEMLRLALVRHADTETLDRLTRGLLAMRRNGSFGCACENAAALGALIAVAQTEPDTAFTGSATLAARN